MFNDPFDFESPLAKEAKRVLSDDFKRRLQRAETEIAMTTAVEREALCEWLGGMMFRPPLKNPTAAFAPMRALVEALWWDLADRTPDPAEPLALSPRIIDGHPWGEGPES